MSKFFRSDQLCSAKTTMKDDIVRDVRGHNHFPNFAKKAKNRS